MEINKQTVSTLADVGTSEILVTYVPIVKRYSFVTFGEQWCDGYLDGEPVTVSVSHYVTTTTYNGTKFYYSTPLRTSFPYVMAGVTYVVNVKVQTIDFSKY